MSSRSISATRTSTEKQTRIGNFKFNSPTSSTKTEVESNREETESLRKIFHSEFKDLESEIIQLKSQYGEESNISNTFSERKSIPSTFRLDNNWLETKNVEIQDENAKLEMENELLRKKIDEIRQQTTKKVEAEAKATMETLHEKLEKHKTVESQVEKLVSENEERTETIIELQRTFHQMQTEFEEAKFAKQQQLAQQHQLKEKRLRETSLLQKEISENEQKIASLNDLILSVNTENEDFLSDLEEKSIKAEAKTEQNIEDLTEKISILQRKLDETDQKEKILNFWKKAREMSIRKEELQTTYKNLTAEVKKFLNLSKQQQKQLKDLQKFENVPTQEYLDNLQRKVSDLKQQHQQQKAAFANQAQNLKTREQECHQRQKTDESKLCEERSVLREQVSVLEKENLRLQHEQNTQNMHQQRDLIELTGKCERIKKQAACELERYRDLLTTEGDQMCNRPVDMHFLQRLENEALYNLGVLDRETQFLLRDKQQPQLSMNISSNQLSHSVF